MTEQTWISQNHDGEDGQFDQEIDLGDGWWAAIGPDSRHGWSWDLYDHWAIDSPDETIAEGHASSEAAAKDAALTEYRRLIAQTESP